MTDELYAIAQDVKQALDRAEAAYPDSKELKVLHFHLGRLLNAHRDGLGDERFAILGGGTNKTPPGDGG